MKKLTYLIIFLVLGCGSRPSNEGVGYSYKKLSEEEAKKLITPTIYHIVNIDERNLNCTVESQKQLRTKSEELLATVCAKSYQACVLQGTCRVHLKDETLLLNVSTRINGEYRFINLTSDLCRYGHGPNRDQRQTFKKMCLDPYHSIAADLSIYKLGDVIYIPAFVGLKLENQETHDGYFIVRDSGSNIKGYGRFDFFLGDGLQNASRQSFLSLGLVDKNTHYPYFLVDENYAKKILSDRNFPYLPNP